MQKSLNNQNHLQDISEDGPSEKESEVESSDIQKLEALFKKVQSQYGYDKVKLVKSLLESGNGGPPSASGSR